MAYIFNTWLERPKDLSIIKKREIPESLLTAVSLHGFVCGAHSVLITNMSLMIVLLLQSINGLRDILLPYVGHCIMVSCVQWFYLKNSITGTSNLRQNLV